MLSQYTKYLFKITRSFSTDTFKKLPTAVTKTVFQVVISYDRNIENPAELTRTAPYIIQNELEGEFLGSTVEVKCLLGDIPNNDV